MNSEKFKKVKEIYQAVLEVSPDKRNSFLNEICGDDEELRDEVKSLLTFEDTFDSFIDSPPESLAAEMLYGQAENLAGKTLAHYKIISLLGEGGMGAVYLAKDTKLLRKVALKILPPEVVENENRVGRFIHEARAASALNHPNILTIYETGETENLHFIAMEFVEGETLREKIYRRQTDFKKLMEYLAQTADGLAKAHAAGIVHRDLKPENIMVSGDGFTKILDFGRAKLVESETDLRKFQQHKSIKGVIMGTPGYMSPEQARGKAVDRRSDIFSFGCILYEAVVKQKPFVSDSAIDALHKIIHDEPPEIENIPAELRNVIGKCLMKKPDERFQTAQEIAAELRNLKINANERLMLSGEEKNALFKSATPTKPISQTFFEQRRQATVLFADYSALNEFLEEAEPEEISEITNDLWSRLEQIIKENGGRAEKHAGDIFAAFWGAKQTSEEDPENAIHAALALQNETQKFINDSDFFKEIQKLQSSTFNLYPFLKIGISTGTTLFGQSTDTGGFSATGAAVNMAKRLHQSAAAGSILISLDTYRHARGVFDVAEIELKEKFTFKKAGQTKVYEIFRAKPRAFRVGRRGVEGIETELVGRDGELEKMLDALETVLEDGEMQIVNVCGDAGLGKSRLLDEFVNRVELMPEKIRVFKGRATETMRGLPFSLARDVFSFRFEIRDSDSPAEAREKLVKGLLSLIGASGGDFGASEEAEMKAHFIGHLIGFDFSGSPFLKGVLDDERQMRDRASHYAAQFFSTISRQLPTIIFLDDLHSADDASLDFFQNVSGNCRNCSLLILEFFRPILFERRPHWGEGELHRVRLDLPPLSKRESRRLVENILQKMAGGIPKKLRDLIVTNAEGNPFYIEELIKMLIERQIINTETDEWQFDESRLGNLGVPPTLTGVLQARLDKLSVGERRILQQASIIGRDFWGKAIESFGNEINVQIVLESLRRKELLFRHETSAFADADEYIFKHALLRDATYETVLIGERRELHEKAARWLINACGERGDEYAAAIAGHFENARMKHEAAEWFGRAGEKARIAHAPETAVNYYQKAIDFQSSAEGKNRITDEFLEWQNNLGNILRSLARFSESIETFKAMLKAAKTADNKLSQSRAWYGLSVAHLENGDNQAALETAEKAVKTARQAGKSVEAFKTLAFSLFRQGRAVCSFGKYTEAIELGEQALQIAEEAGDAALAERGFCFHLLALGNMNLGNFDKARVYVEQELELMRKAGNKRLVGNGLNSLGESFRLQGDGQKAVSYFQEAIAIAREIGNRVGEIMILSNLGGAKLLIGDYVSAENDLRQVIRLSGKEGNFSLPETYRFLAKALLEQNKKDEALAAARKSLELSVEAENQENIGCAWRVLGSVISRLQKPLTIENESYSAPDCFTKSLRIFDKI